MNQANQQALPKLGAALHGGLYAGVTTDKDGAVYALILLPDTSATTWLNWHDAMSWAKGLDAALPTRVESALLFANLPDEFAKEWHWTSEQSSGSDAWTQYFGDGDQGHDGKSAEGRVRAVRRLPVNPSILSAASETAATAEA